MAEDQEKKEVIIKAPAKQIIDSQRKIEKATEEALEEERYTVLQWPKRFSKYIGYTSTAIGALLFVLLCASSLSAEANWAVLSSQASLPIIGIWILTGLVSVIVGFLLIGSE